MSDEAKDGAAGRRPVPVRDLMQRLSPEDKDPGAEARPVPAHRFTADGEDWIAQVAGGGAYGTGERGAAYVTAIHFFKAADPEQPLREALIPSDRFPGLFEEELAALLAEATPIDLDDR